jgi:hypothetical protein
MVMLTLVGACESSPRTPHRTPATATHDAQVPPMPPMPTTQPLTLDWQLTRSGDRLQLSYSVHNDSDKALYLLDRLVVPSSKGLEAAFDRVIVRDGDAAGVVSFVRGYAPPFADKRGGIGGIQQPAAQKLEAGQTITGTATVPLPLTAWHNFGPAQPLTGAPTQAYLEIGYLLDHDKWASLELVDGTKLSGPANPFVADQRMVRSDTRPIP